MRMCWVCVVPALFLGLSCPSAGLHSGAPHPGPTPAEQSFPAEHNIHIRVVIKYFYLNVFLLIRLC